MFVEFRNPGSMDMNAVTLIGVSAKQEISAIGKFGTGLKYVIAAHVRTRTPLAILTNGNVYSFEPDPMDYRGKYHEQILMRCNGVEQCKLGFTTHYGEHWEPWMLFRELWSNMLDEHGEGRLVNQFDDQLPEPGVTKIYSGHPGVIEAYQNRGNFFIDKELTPIFENALVRVFSKAQISRVGLFFKSVYVGQPPFYEPQFIYDFKEGVTLTEDRSILITNFIDRAVCGALLESPDLFQAAVCEGDGEFWEAMGLGWRGFIINQPEIIENIRRTLRIGKGPETLLRRLLKAANVNDAYEDYTPTRIEAGWIEDALAFAASELNLAARTVRTVQSIAGPSVLGAVENDKILLSSFCFHKGRSEVFRTVIEELVHIHTGFTDGSRMLQTYLFDRWIGLAEQNAELREQRLFQPKSGI